MSRAQAEQVIKNIIQEISQECAAKGFEVSETLAAFMVKAAVLDPANQFNVDRTLAKEDIQKLIRVCVARLSVSKSPALDTIKMQVYFDMNYTSREEFLAEHHKVMDARMEPYVREICDSRARIKDDLEALYRKIVSAVVLQSGLGSPTDVTIIRETTAALQSVFPQSELPTFTALTKRDKERQLHELTMIVTGIRLFNKECGKGGELIDNLPVLLNQAIPDTNKSIDVEMQRSLLEVSQYIALGERPQSASPDALSISMLKQSIINCRQNQAYLNVILRDVVRCAQQVEQLQSQLASRMQQLHVTVSSKQAVPTAQVYPQFMHVAQIWIGFQNELVLLSILNNILQGLEAFSRNHRAVFTEEILRPHLVIVNVKTDQERLNQVSVLFLNPSVPSQVKVGKNQDQDTGSSHSSESSEHQLMTTGLLMPETTPNLFQLPLQYRGFCGWTLVVNDRILVQGNPMIGVLQHNDNYYAFASRKAADAFSAEPDKFIAQALEIAKTSPELIQLLGLHEQFASVEAYGQGKRDSMGREMPRLKSDSGTQTDVHFYESNIVKSYEWNEWELRRQAIKLANIRTKVTRSVQTNLSNFRRDNAVQCLPLKDLATQTIEDRISTVPKPHVFLSGMRGGGMSVPTVVTKVDLTLDVEYS